jgi:hypothetical protein
LFIRKAETEIKSTKKIIFNNYTLKNPIKSKNVLATNYKFNQFLEIKSNYPKSIEKKLFLNYNRLSRSVLIKFLEIPNNLKEKNTLNIFEKEKVIIYMLTGALSNVFNVTYSSFEALNTIGSGTKHSKFTREVLRTKKIYSKAVSEDRRYLLYKFIKTLLNLKKYSNKNSKFLKKYYDRTLPSSKQLLRDYGFVKLRKGLYHRLLELNSEK